uniref:Cyclin N-terminal domain-containing protein n=1 Tax=Acrobeloides nanus TaxID=290746 RepID=A0A914C1J0_9BILA
MAQKPNITTGSIHQQAERIIEPDFSDRSAELHDELIPEWIATLLEENRDRIDGLTDVTRIWMRAEVVQYIFTICLRLHLPREVKYLALSIFDQFMSAHIMGLSTLVKYLTCRTEEQKFKEWEKIESTVSRQLTLRVLSVIQIASKLQSYHDSLSKKQLKRCLQTLGSSYTEEAVVKSELRVLRTINFYAAYRNTPVTYIESMLKVLVLRKPEVLNAKTIWDYALLVLDCVYLQLDVVYRGVLNVVHGEMSGTVSKDRMRRIQCDYSLLAAGVIACACVCVHGPALTNEVIMELSKISSVSVEDITDMSTGCIEKIITHEETGPN